MQKKTNKTIAGYHLLMILSAVDYRFHQEEEKVILEYLKEEFPFYVSLDQETDLLASLSPEEWKKHFEFQAQCFYDDSTEEERKDFLKFAKSLIKANDVVTDEEHDYYSIIKNIFKTN
ncbi:TerB family tellurite resistance protein [Elizabethkingia sp. JS20170427COW]|uniref:tellurite resistance TerB family protein n=1 Tax=Elizabethkingia sp. JS20170427COW TaxID=2583851 RepID=UPI001110458D|nr:TerB family tellurite resistance protein [Elizabethkingia sp. JS20170427COW]QCX53855.1 TerB family tellurite resistance protein [Elizabethkingia sp. JS20170427COW]